jgi:hypothetical protein
MPEKNDFLAISSATVYLVYVNAYSIYFACFVKPSYRAILAFTLKQLLKIRLYLVCIFELNTLPWKSEKGIWILAADPIGLS